MAIKFTDDEIKALEGSPEALRALADWHCCRETEAASIGEPFEECVTIHDNRKKELRAEADRIEAEY